MSRRGPAPRPPSSCPTASSLKAIRKTRLGSLALRYASADLFKLEGQEIRDDLAAGCINPSSVQADAMEFEACENDIDDGEVRQIRRMKGGGG